MLIEFKNCFTIAIRSCFQKANDTGLQRTVGLETFKRINTITEATGNEWIT